MPTYSGNNKIKEMYYGSHKIKEAYYGSNKVYVLGYPQGTVLFENSVAGSYTINVKHDCTVYIDLVGAGGGGTFGRIGGSGAYIYGQMQLTAGTYNIIIGHGGVIGTAATSSTFEGNIAGAGSNVGATIPITDGYGGTATVATTGLSGQNGITGSTVGWINGYGAGSGSTGVDGYCKIVVL